MLVKRSGIKEEKMMKKMNVKTIKKLVVITLSAIMLVSSVVCFSAEMNAAEATPKTVCWSETSIEIAKYRGETEAEYTAPEKEGYVFAGWYATSGSEQSAIGADVKSGAYFAKYIPEEVLSVYGQVTKGTNATTSSTNMRLLTMIDHTKYEAIGMQVEINGNPISEELTTTTTIYRTVQADGQGTVTPKDYCDSAEYFATVLLTNIPAVGYDKPVYVRPFLETQDGTRVYGVDRFLYVDNSYDGTFTVTVRARENEDIAAALLELTYEATDLEFVGVEERLFKDTENGTQSVFYDNKNGTVKYVGNVSDITKDVSSSENGMLVGFKFKKKASVTGEKTYTFDVASSICDKNETMKELTVVAPSYKK